MLSLSYNGDSEECSFYLNPKKAIMLNSHYVMKNCMTKIMSIGDCGVNYLYCLDNDEKKNIYEKNSGNA